MKNPCAHWDAMHGDAVCMRLAGLNPRHIGICFPHAVGSYEYCPYYQEADE